MILDLLIKRRSFRSFKHESIPREVLDSILEAGRLSPSGGNEQPWRFGVITDPNIINDISQAAYQQKWIQEAPLLIVLVTTIVPDERGGRNIQISRFPKWLSEIEQMNHELYASLNQEEHQTKIPGTHMMLAALEHGVGSTWISYFNVAKVAEILALPDFFIPSEIIAFGYPKTEIPPRAKKRLEEIVFYNRYNRYKQYKD